MSLRRSLRDGPPMRRRELLALIAGAALSWPRIARAQQVDGTKRIAILMGIGEDAEGRARVAAFRQGLADRRWQDGCNIRIDLRWGAGDMDKINADASELVGLGPDVILATNTPTARVLKQATATIPIMFAGLSDPVTDGVVESLANPGGNITGFTSLNAALAGKWLQLLKEAAPGVRHVAVMYNPATAPFAIFLPVVEAVAPRVRMMIERASVNPAAEIEQAIEKLAATPGGGLVIMPDVFMQVQRDLIFSLTMRHRLPTMCPTRTFVTNGGLMSYSSNFDELFREAASYVDRILRGEKPRDLPLQDPTKYELIINLKTAKSIGLEVPWFLQQRADEVIE
jgi:putative ABC transport system substrate-binding protein